MSIRAVRYHDFSAGHRVVGHENKCRWIHGHNYRVTFFCEGQLDDVGRVIDFGVIKNKLCDWLERKWDHKFLMWREDPMLDLLKRASEREQSLAGDHLRMSLHVTEFNPTAENMAGHLLRNIGPEILGGTGVKLTKVIVEETRKCSAEVEL